MNATYRFWNEDEGKRISKILYKCLSSLFPVAFTECRQMNEMKKNAVTGKRKTLEQETLQKIDFISMAGNKTKNNEPIEL